MPQLQHLDGRPQTWDELHARLADYYARFEMEPVCSLCASGKHGVCTGRKRVNGTYAECSCECWEEVR